MMIVRRQLNIFLLFGILICLHLQFSCKTMENISSTHFHECPSSIQAMLEELNCSRKQLESDRFNGKELILHGNVRPNNNVKIKAVILRDEFRVYGFFKRQIIWISQSNIDGFFDTDIKDFNQLYKTLGKEDINLTTRADFQARELVYLKLGISIIAAPPENKIIDIFVFHPMSEEEYKRLVWDDPSHYQKGVIY